MGLVDEAAASYRLIGAREDEPGLAAAAWSALARLESARDRVAEADAARGRSRELAAVVEARPRLWFFRETEGMPAPASETTLRQARAAALHGRVEDAFVLGLQAIVEAGSGDDDPVIMVFRCSLPCWPNAKPVAWRTPCGIGCGRYRKPGSRTRCCLALRGARACRYLIDLRDGAAKESLSRYRDLAALAHGAASGTVVDALRLSLEFGGNRATADELAELCRQTRDLP
jgi:hypothetical protein